MELIQKKINAILLRYKATGILHVGYALLAEALLIGFVFFAGLFTLETLLPTFVTVRLSLTKFFFFLVIGTMLLSLLGHFLQVSFPWNITKKNFLLWGGILWGIGILTLSLLKFPPLLIGIILLLFLASGYLFWNIFSEEN
ncbi:MAG: hypothetical protein KBD27_02850 [Candidatus Moranbacteria bacterium]|nr:hypothetical protein [Candidatus Moranbacteria bacterium]